MKMTKILAGMVFFAICLSLSVPLLAKGRGWRTDESEKYLRWWDRTYQGTDSAVIGGILYQKGDYEEAIKELEQAVQNGSADGKVYYQLASSYQQTGDIQKAITLYQKAAELLAEKNPAHRYSYYSRYNLALLYKDQGQIDKAIGAIKKAIAQYKDEPSGYNLLGWLYWEKGDSDSALKEYKQSIKVDPNQEDAQYNIGILYYNKGRMQKAKESFNKVISLNSDNEKASFYLDNLGDEIALKEKQYSTLTIPDPALRNCYLAKQKIDSKEYEKAAEEYELALGLNPSCIQAHHGLGVVYEYNDKGVRYGDGCNIRKSIFHYEKALAIDPNQEDVIYNLAILYDENGNTDNSIRMYLRLIRLDPNSSQVHYNLAVLYDNRTDNFKKARHHYNRYLQLEPDTTRRREVEERIRRTIR